MARDKRRRFGKLTNETLKRHQEQSGGGFDRYVKDGVSMWTPKEGKRSIRILPWSDTGEYGYEIWVHYDVGPDNSRYVCPNKMGGAPCPMCDERRDIMSGAGADDEDAKKAADRLAPRKAVAMWILDRDNEADGPQLFMAPPTKVDKEIALRAVDPDTGRPLQIHDLDDGYDIYFRREGAGLKTQYTGIEIARRPSPVYKSEDQTDKLEDWLTDNPLDKIFVVRDYAYLTEVFSGKRSTRSDNDEPDRSSRRADRDDDADERDDRPARRRDRADRDDDRDEEDAPPPRRRDRTDEDEERDADDRPPRRARDDRDEDDDADAKAAAEASERLRRRRAPRDEADTHDADDADHDEEDATPRRRRR